MEQNRPSPNSFSIQTRQWGGRLRSFLKSPIWLQIAAKEQDSLKLLSLIPLASRYCEIKKIFARLVQISLRLLAKYACV